MANEIVVEVVADSAVGVVVGTCPECGGVLVVNHYCVESNFSTNIKYSVWTECWNSLGANPLCPYERPAYVWEREKLARADAAAISKTEAA